MKAKCLDRFHGRPSWMHPMSLRLHRENTAAREGLLVLRKFRHKVIGHKVSHFLKTYAVSKFKQSEWPTASGTGPTAGGGQSSRVSPSPVAPEKSTQARSEFYFSGSDGRLCHKEAFVIIDHTSKPTFITRDSLVARLRDDNDVVKSRELARLLKLYKERESDISKTDPWNLKKRTEKGSVGYIIKHLDTYLGDYAARNINVLSAVPKRKLKVPADPLDSQNFDYHECAFKVKSA